MSCFGVECDGDHDYLIRAIGDTVSSTRIQERLVQLHGMPSENVWLAKEAATLGTEQMVVRGSKRSESSSVSGQEKVR